MAISATTKTAPFSLAKFNITPNKLSVPLFEELKTNFNETTCNKTSYTIYRR
mgnify:CR=1 FL=1